MKIVVIGSGPVGLYAAFRLVKSGHHVTLIERGAAVASNVRSWGFVRLFSTMELNMPQDAKQALLDAGHKLPDESAYLTGGEFVTTMLEPLAAWLLASGRCELKTGWEAACVGRSHFLKGDAIMGVGDKRRVGAKFRILLRNVSSGDEVMESGADVVIDASGNYDARTANRVGVGGLPALGERAAEAAGLIRRTIPDVLGSDRSAVSGKRVGVIGTGYSAITCLRGLYDLAQAGGAGSPAEVIWFTRQPAGKLPYSILENDPLPQRQLLAKFGNGLVESMTNDVAKRPFGAAKFEYVPAMACTAVGCIGDSLKVSLDVDGEAVTERSLDVDVLYSLTGFHPDSSLWSEIQVHTCYASDGPMKLAASLLAAKIAAEGDPAAAGDCMKQAAPGVETLDNPEPDFYVIGMKSYGRNSSFLMRVGYEQVGLLAKRLNLASNLLSVA